MSVFWPRYLDQTEASLPVATQRQQLRGKISSASSFILLFVFLDSFWRKIWRAEVSYCNDLTQGLVENLLAKRRSYCCSVPVKWGWHRCGTPLSRCDSTPNEAFGSGAMLLGRKGSALRKACTEEGSTMGKVKRRPMIECLVELLYEVAC